MGKGKPYRFHGDYKKTDRTDQLREGGIAQGPAGPWLDKMEVLGWRSPSGSHQQLPTPAGSSSQHQTTAGTDSSLEEILRQAECKQQQGEGVERSSSRLPLEGWMGGGLLEREPAK